MTAIALPNTPAPTTTTSAVLCSERRKAAASGADGGGDGDGESKISGICGRRVGDLQFPVYTQVNVGRQVDAKMNGCGEFDNKIRQDLENGSDPFGMDRDLGIFGLTLDPELHVLSYVTQPSQSNYLVSNQ